MKYIWKNILVLRLLLLTHAQFFNYPVPQCPSNEEYTECVVTCNECETKGNCEQFTCDPGCDCIFGFFRNHNGICVPEYQCERTCPYNEEYTPCVIPCDDCKTRGRCQVATCQEGCNCIHGFFRDESGICVPDRMCQRMCPVNEEYTPCAIPCDDCTLRGHCQVKICREGCNCIKGYYRDKNNICVPEDMCPKFCPLNEEYSSCAIPCDDCRNRGRCEVTTCQEGCNCIKGYYRDKNNICVPEDMCPIAKSCPRNQVYYNCIPTCKCTCDNYYYEGQCFNYNCKPGCFCKPGLVMDNYGECINPRYCRKSNCGLNEEYSRCAIPCNTCAERGDCDYYTCGPGCDCRRGFYRNDSNICVPESDCPKHKCGKNEVYTDCVSQCNTCEEQGMCYFGECKAGCDCAYGFYRNKYNACVSASECKAGRCGAYEEYKTCGPACQKTCKNRFIKIACVDQCQSGCFCEKGYVRNDYGKCILEEKCPPGRCGAYEEYKTCGPACQRTCKNRFIKIVCVDKCQSGCFCEKGYVRNDDGKCILEEQCPPDPVPKDICPPDQRYEPCPSLCNTTCRNYFERKSLCQLRCRPGCVCKYGKVKNELGKCVLPEECLNACKPDEQIYDCIPDCKNTCENYEKPYITCKIGCTPGCYCKKGLLKRKDGKCVTPDNCDIPCKPNEQFYNCMPDCKNTCINFNKRNAKCPKICKPGCFCKKGLVKTFTGKCVTPNKCPRPCTKKCPPIQVLFRSSRNETFDYDDEISTTETTILINDTETTISGIHSRSRNGDNELPIEFPEDEFTKDVTVFTTKLLEVTTAKNSIIKSSSTIKTVKPTRSTTVKPSAASTKKPIEVKTTRSVSTTNNPQTNAKTTLPMNGKTTVKSIVSTVDSSTKKPIEVKTTRSVSTTNNPQTKAKTTLPITGKTTIKSIVSTVDSSKTTVQPSGTTVSFIEPTKVETNTSNVSTANDSPKETVSVVSSNNENPSLNEKTTLSPTAKTTTATKNKPALSNKKNEKPSPGSRSSKPLNASKNRKPTTVSPQKTSTPISTEKTTPVPKITTTTSRKTTGISEQSTSSDFVQKDNNVSSTSVSGIQKINKSEINELTNETTTLSL